MVYTFVQFLKRALNHKYDTIDYLQVDPEFGDKDLFAKVVDEKSTCTWYEDYAPCRI